MKSLRELTHPKEATAPPGAAAHAAVWGVAVAAALFAASVTGCVATAISPPPRSVTVSGPPPAPLAEERPAPVAAGGAWVAGYWHWTGIQYAWIPGHWEASPPPGAVWEAPRYSGNGGAYFYEPGQWRASPRANAIR